MEKINKTLLFLSMIVIAVVGLTACGDDDEPADGSHGLSGWYASQLPSKGSDDWGGRAYNFINGNTVEYYPTISGSPRWTGNSEALPGPMSGYYIQQGIRESYTYEIRDNKVYIPLQGTILTINGNTLTRDGGGVFTKM